MSYLCACVRVCVFVRLRFVLYALVFFVLPTTLVSVVLVLMARFLVHSLAMPAKAFSYLILGILASSSIRCLKAVCFMLDSPVSVHAQPSPRNLQYYVVLRGRIW